MHQDYQKYRDYISHKDLHVMKKGKVNTVVLQLKTHPLPKKKKKKIKYH